MRIEQIVTLLTAERDRLTRAIDALRGTTPRQVARPVKKTPAKAVASIQAALVTPAPQKRTLSAAGRKAIAEAARRRWAKIKAGKAPSPFAKAKKG